MIKPEQTSEPLSLTRSKVLFVDDEKEILTALRRGLRGEPYACLFAETPAEAIALHHDQPVQVVVSDMYMPGMPGDQLLAHFQKQSPETIRLILSGWHDSDTILQAINNGQIYRYIVKPWDDRELKIIIRQALELYNVQAEKAFLMKQLEAHNKSLEQTIARRTEQLLALSRQAEIGKYASQIVHNLNNPLHALTGALDLAGLYIAETGEGIPEELTRTVELARRSTGDLQRIVSGILDHARDKRSFHLEKVDVNKIIRQELDYLNINPLFRNQVEKRIDLAPDLPAVVGSNVQIKQIINNLVANAVDAMENKSQQVLSIKTAVEGDFVLIEVKDSGTGIAASDFPHLFSPDFTTKPPGKGTGLGLASVKTMVDAYAGDIQVASEAGRGACFSVRLPFRSKPLAPVAAMIY
jgi:signal transduction histidine kinase